MRKRVAAGVRARLRPDRVLLLDESANCFGVESGGKWQIRGNGCLGATTDEILFVMWFPRRDIHVPRARVTGIERAKGHLGKTVFRPLLQVRFTNEEGQADSVAWLVSDLPEWERVLGAPSS